MKGREAGSVKMPGVDGVTEVMIGFAVLLSVDEFLGTAHFIETTSWTASEEQFNI